MEPTKPRAVDKVEDLPWKGIQPDTAEQIRGGKARRGSHDDDLEELPVQR